MASNRTVEPAAVVRWFSIRRPSFGKAAVVALACTAYVYAGDVLTSAEHGDETVAATEVAAWRWAVDRESALLDDDRRAVSAATNVLQERLVAAQARLSALEAATRALMAAAGVSAGTLEDAVADPAVEERANGTSAAKLGAMLDEAIGEIDQRERELDVLDELLVQSKTEPRGRPVTKGWISSPYGERTDPFTGDPAVHRGVDIAAVAGAPVLAVADGLVTWSGLRSGYGQTIEITHRRGLVTRYAHNAENLVTLGDIVHRGQEIARLGSTGRATGPNLHFEVLRDRRRVDPMSYIE